MSTVCAGRSGAYARNKSSAQRGLRGIDRLAAQCQEVSPEDSARRRRIKICADDESPLAETGRRKRSVAGHTGARSQHLVAGGQLCDACRARPGGEIGRRKRLKISQPSGYPGSTPGPGTIWLETTFRMRNISPIAAFSILRSVGRFLCAGPECGGEIRASPDRRQQPAGVRHRVRSQRQVRRVQHRLRRTRRTPLPASNGRKRARCRDLPGHFRYDVPAPTVRHTARCLSAEEPALHERQAVGSPRRALPR